MQRVTMIRSSGERVAGARGGQLRSWAVRYACLLVAVGAGFPAEGTAAEKIQPGMLWRTPDSPGGCTANFIYDGIGPMAGRTFIGTASHCWGDLMETRAVDQDKVLFGHLVLKNWPLKTVADDYALMEIIPERLRDVDPSMKGHPTYPTGVAMPEDVKPGDQVQISGWGSFMYLHDDLREQRRGVVSKWDGSFYDMVAPILFGDSGGGLAHLPTGKALGLVSAFCTPTNWSPDRLPAVGCTVYGPSIAEVERRAAEQGFPIRMRRAGEPPPPPPHRPAPSEPAGQPPRPPERPANKKSKKATRAACMKKAKKAKNRAARTKALRKCRRSDRSRR